MIYTDDRDSPVLIPTNDRIHTTAKFFGDFFPLRLEPFIYHTASRLSADYDGGYWDFYTIKEDCFLMCPDTKETLKLECPNQFAGTVSADAFGIIVCLYAYSHFSFDCRQESAKVCAWMYYLLKEHAAGHPECEAILRAID